MSESQREAIEAVKAGNVDEVRRILQQNPSSARERDENGVSAVTTAVYYGQTQIAQLLVDCGAEIDVHAAAALGQLERLDELIASDHALLTSQSPDGWSPLALAAFFGQGEAARRLLALGANVDQRSTNASSNMPLHAALAGKHFDIVRTLLDAGADVNAQDGDGWTPVHIASHEGPPALVRLLLERGADPSIAKRDGTSPIMTAERQGLPEIVALLRGTQRAGEPSPAG
jgi:ankyrin repeat protein